MILVIDITKGIQTQTAECLVIGEVTCQKMIVVLNKTDLLPEGERAVLVDKVTGLYISLQVNEICRILEQLLQF
jgi:selenocysteine-specific elongation factor